MSTDQGATWEVIGAVLKPDYGVLHPIQDAEFTASDWGYIGSITAAAVNAIHLKSGQNGKHGTVFSFLPLEFYDDAPITASYRDNDASIITDIPGGSGIFGTLTAVRVGDPYFLQSPIDRKLLPWPPNHAPQIGETLVIISQLPPITNWTIEFENKFGGNVTFFDGQNPKIIARVFRPVTGVGRFGGGIFQTVGRIRANHPGVICISTSPFGQEGGFQIVPAFHCNEYNLAYVKETPVYMVLGPASADSIALEGTNPLYSSFIRAGDIVEAKINGSWGAFPEASGKDFTVLKNVEAVRIRPQFQLIH